MTLNRKLLFFETIDSTHEYAKLHADLFDPNALTCLRAHTQTKGRGQNDRTWLSLKGNLFVSYVVKIPPRVYPESANFLALCLYLTIRKEGKKVLFKEPNDLYFEGKKCAGFLCHQVGDRLILSYGLNTQHAPEEFSALELETEKIFRQLDTMILEQIPRFLKQGFSPFTNEWNKVEHFFKK
jgi:BirA family biotin operon repressor/biotin-[acetyl-CoA-carboxylase] ligase